MTTESLSSALLPTFASVAEVAHDLQVTERFVRHLIATGELRAVKVGARLVRIRRSDVEALLRPFGGAG